MRQSIALFQQHTGAAVVPSSQPTHSSISNLCEIDNDMGISKPERLHLNSSQQSQGFPRSFAEHIRSRSNLLPYSSNTPRGTNEGIVWECFFF